jgi:hypothetical protein
MMGVGFIFMLLFLLVLIGIPLLIIALVARGGRATLFRSRHNPSPPTNAPPAPVQPAYVRKCPTCGRGVKVDWNVCPSCGAALN